MDLAMVFHHSYKHHIAALISLVVEQVFATGYFQIIVQQGVTLTAFAH
jgi:hypothetical protein